MKYFLLLAGTDIPWEDLSEEEQAAEMAKHGDFDAAIAAHPAVEMVGGDALGEGAMATTVRTSNDDITVTDGPFAEAAEQIGGYYVLESPDLDSVIELCRILSRYTIDIRPVLEMP